MSQNNLYRFSY